MKAGWRELPGRFAREESGQTIIMFAIMMIMMLAMAGFVIDIGRAMVVNSQLTSGTIAAALAGANEMPNSDYATVAQNYSSIDEYNSSSKTYTTGNNTYASLPNVQTTAAAYCSSFVANTLDVNCVNMGSSSANALVVTQTVTMPTTFIRVLGIDSLTFTSTQTAAWKGSAGKPYNVAVIVDSTQSMTSVDTGSDGCNSTPAIACALSGVQAMLEDANLVPCTGTGACSSSGAKPLDEVSLYTFPGVSNATAASDDATCANQISSASSSTGGFGVNDSTTYYGFPGSSFSGSALMPSPPVYQIVGFSDDYKSGGSNVTSLNTGSTLVKAAGGAGNCTYNSASTGSGRGRTTVSWGGLQDVGGAGTYYAGIIYQAQNDLYNQYVSRQNSGTQTQNIMVILSDGDATSSSTQMGGCKTYYTTGSKAGQCETTQSNGNSGGTYPSYNDECQQAVTAAEDATNGTWPTANSGTAKTTVYTVAYGAETSGCSELPPCTTMQEMASSYIQNKNNSSAYPDAQEDFYSDYLDTATGSADTSCTSSNGITSIPAIFHAIAASLSTSKIMSNPAGCTASSASTTICN